jgi:sulfatase modifying factor 1
VASKSAGIRWRAWLVAAIPACSLFPDLGGLTGGDGGDASATDAPADTTLGDSSTDAGADSSTDAGSDASCAPTAGIAAVLASLNGTSVCIDSTEITVAAYTTFLAAKSGDTSGQPPYCAFNTTYVPTVWPQNKTNAPVVQVDWCDAFAFCAWAGKRMCGAAKGGHSDAGYPSDPINSQWYFACSHDADGLHTYPYGNAYGKTTCNGLDNGDAGVVNTASMAGCAGGFPGVFDMSGNVWEWEDACHYFDGGADYCVVRGGSFQSASSALTCSANLFAPRSNTFTDIGVRCCSP